MPHSIFRGWFTIRSMCLGAGIISIHSRRTPIARVPSVAAARDLYREVVGNDIPPSLAVGELLRANAIQEGKPPLGAGRSISYHRRSSRLQILRHVNIETVWRLALLRLAAVSERDDNRVQLDRLLKLLTGFRVDAIP